MYNQNNRIRNRKTKNTVKVVQEKGQAKLVHNSSHFLLYSVNIRIMVFLSKNQTLFPFAGQHTHDQFASAITRFLLVHQCYRTLSAIRIL